MFNLQKNPQRELPVCGGLSDHCFPEHFSPVDELAPTTSLLSKPFENTYFYGYPPRILIHGAGDGVWRE